MTSSVEVTQSNWRAPYDGKAFSRVMEASFKSNRKSWFKSAIRQSLSYAFWGAVFFYPGAFHAHKDGVLFGMAIMAGGGLLSGFMLVYTDRDARLKAVVKADKDEHWVCQLTEEYFVTTDSNGIERRYPWRIMELQMETPDAFVFEWPRGSMVVFRKPLQEAGIEG